VKKKRIDNCSLFHMERWSLQSCLDLSARLQKTNRNDFFLFHFFPFGSLFEFFKFCKSFALFFWFFPPKTMLQARIKATSLAERFLNMDCWIFPRFRFSFRVKKILDISSHLVLFSPNVVLFPGRWINFFQIGGGRKVTLLFSSSEEIAPLYWYFYIVYVVYLYNNNYIISFDWLESKPEDSDRCTCPTVWLILFLECFSTALIKHILLL